MIANFENAHLKNVCNLHLLFPSDPAPDEEIQGGVPGVPFTSSRRVCNAGARSALLEAAAESPGLASS